MARRFSDEFNIERRRALGVGDFKKGVVDGDRRLIGRGGGCSRIRTEGIVMEVGIPIDIRIGRWSGHQRVADLDLAEILIQPSCILLPDNRTVEPAGTAVAKLADPPGGGDIPAAPLSLFI